MNEQEFKAAADAIKMSSPAVRSLTASSSVCTIIGSLRLVEILTFAIKLCDWYLAIPFLPYKNEVRDAKEAMEKAIAKIKEICP